MLAGIDGAWRFTSAFLGFSLAAFLLAGCGNIPKLDGARHGPFFQPSVFHAAESMPADIRRVVVLPIADIGMNTEETLSTLDAASVRALNLAARFECVHLSRDDMMRLVRARSILSVEVLPHDLFDRLAQDYGADAVLFTDLVHYAPYPPLSLGIRAKLYRLNDRSLIWAIDQTFDSANPAVANSARRYWLNSEPSGTPADMSGNALNMPSRFGTYVLSAAFETLPKRK
jgi:hypothetical protein